MLIPRLTLARALGVLLLGSSLLAAVSSTHAQAHTPAAAADAAAPVPAAVLQAFGGAPGLLRLSDDFVDRLNADPRTAPFFKDVNLRNTKKQLADQFCAVLNGPCVYEGETMKNSHADLKIARKDFNALVELLQQSMDAQGVPFAAQNQLLAKLAPMHRDVITVH